MGRVTKKQARRLADPQRRQGTKVTDVARTYPRGSPEFRAVIRDVPDRPTLQDDVRIKPSRQKL